MRLEERARRAAVGIHRSVEPLPTRAVAAAPGTFESFVRFAERRRRTEQVTAIVVAMILVIAALGAALGLLRGTLERRPADTVITPEEVGDLELEWSVSTGDVNAMVSVVMAGDQVIVTRKLGEPTGKGEMSGRGGELTAYPADCSEPCVPTWTATTDRPILRGAVQAEMVYIAERATGEPGALLYAFDVHCGTDGATCDPLWTGRIGAGTKLNTVPLLAGGKVIVASADGIYAFEVGCGTGGERCDPVWVARPGDARAEPGSAVMASTVSADTVYVASPKTIAAYPVDCKGECEPLWSRPAPQPSQWLAVWDDTLVVGSFVRTQAEGAMQNHAWAFPADCADRRDCDVLWSIETWGVTPVGVANDVLYVTDTMGDLVAYEEPCDADGCRERWRARKPLTQEIAAEPALVVDGVVYISSANGYVLAYPADCERECEAIWQTSQAGYGYTYVVVVAGRVFVGSDGIYAFAVPEADEAESTSSWPGASLPIIPLVVAILAASWFLVRLRRRSRIP